MSLPKLLGIIAVSLFSVILIASFFKNKDSKESQKVSSVARSSPQEIEIEISQLSASALPLQNNTELQPATSTSESLPNADRIEEFFNVAGTTLPIVETITYKSRVPWQKGRPAWLSDYATYYQTSRHFIARSLNGKRDYFKQDVSEGHRFNILKKDKNFQFYLLVDLSRCKMWFYYDDFDKHERVLLKVYNVGLGRIDNSKTSGLLTPLGKYSLGNRIAIYKPKVMGIRNGESFEMIKTFGTRWIPFEKEISGCTAAAKGFGIHGLPWTLQINGEQAQDNSSLGKYQSDGCIRLDTVDIEELFAIIITKPTVIELVRDFHDASEMTKISTEENTAILE